jgi:hypothetical protein
MEHLKLLPTEIDLSTDVNEGAVIDITCYAFAVGFHLPVILTLGAWERCVANLAPFSIEADTERTVILVHALCRALGRHPSMPRTERFRVPVQKNPNEPKQLVEVEAECGRDALGKPFVLVRLVNEEEWMTQN